MASVWKVQTNKMAFFETKFAPKNAPMPLMSRIGPAGNVRPDSYLIVFFNGGNVFIFCEN